ncbi:Rieske 2Fe-2S domain-containing protein [Xanthomonas theicola]|uniref:Rieske 2Fe-2S domain-containing protein n=1 Tax=Xanthomonas theicola TaxID=56464 RepID=UPI0036225C83
MHSLIPAAAYIDEAWFARERECLMRPLWQFAAPRMLLDKPNAFVRRSVYGVDVVVQNFDGELRAFDNLCLHRQNPLQQQAQGVRPLLCGYHGWRYGADGGVDNIPFHDEAYRLPPAAGRARLPAAQALCGGLHRQPGVRESFRRSDAAPNAVLAAGAGHAAEGVGALRQRGAGGHLRGELQLEAGLREPARRPAPTLRASAHPVPAGEVPSADGSGQHRRRTPLSRARQRFAGGTSGAAARFQRWRAGPTLLSPPHYAWHDKVERFGSDDWYLNWLLYPNLHIASGSGGYSFIIEHHQPVSAQRTDLLVYYVTARKKHRYATSDAVLLAHLQGAEKVLREDIDIMESVQSGRRTARGAGRLRAWQHAVRTLVHGVMERRHVL